MARNNYGVSASGGAEVYLDGVRVADNMRVSVDVCWVNHSPCLRMVLAPLPPTTHASCAHSPPFVSPNFPFSVRRFFQH